MNQPALISAQTMLASASEIIQQLLTVLTHCDTDTSLACCSRQSILNKIRGNFAWKMFCQHTARFSSSKKIKKWIISSHNVPHKTKFYNFNATWNKIISVSLKAANASVTIMKRTIIKQQEIGNHKVRPGQPTRWEEKEEDPELDISSGERERESRVSLSDCRRSSPPRPPPTPRPGPGRSWRSSSTSPRPTQRTPSSQSRRCPRSRPSPCWWWSWWSSRWLCWWFWRLLRARILHRWLWGGGPRPSHWSPRPPSGRSSRPAGAERDRRRLPSWWGRPCWPGAGPPRTRPPAGLDSRGTGGRTPPSCTPAGRQGTGGPAGDWRLPAWSTGSPGCPPGRPHWQWDNTRCVARWC